MAIIISIMSFKSSYQELDCKIYYLLKTDGSVELRIGVNMGSMELWKGKYEDFLLNIKSDNKGSGGEEGDGDDVLKQFLRTVKRAVNKANRHPS